MTLQRRPSLRVSPPCRCNYCVELKYCSHRSQEEQDEEVEEQDEEVEEQKKEVEVQE